jgi:hypothetical protein
VPSSPSLTEWDNFYVIIGSSAAALTGLMFVVIALGAEARKVSAAGSEALHAFATPTIVHFGVILLIAAFMTTPRQTTTSLGTCIVLTGAIGFAYVVTVIVKARRQDAYEPELSDWIWYISLPLLTYAALFIEGILVWKRPEVALYWIGATAVVLLFVGIHNAWDGAVWMTTKPPDEDAPSS